MNFVIYFYIYIKYIFINIYSIYQNILIYADRNTKIPEKKLVFLQRKHPGDASFRLIYNSVCEFCLPGRLCTHFFHSGLHRTFSRLSVLDGLFVLRRRANRGMQTGNEVKKRRPKNLKTHQTGNWKATSKKPGNTSKFT